MTSASCVFAVWLTTLFSRELSGDFSSFLVVVLLVRGNPGSTAGRGFNPAGGAPGGNPGSTAGRGFNPAGGAPGGG
ncbi:hypothetical protein F511_20526 [Dorcoceras hygrometricum]|uniref:Uncharacterized protein n=1 Tax=Dorcoceras hygrometricum TaxID=472368 RepID=A0A2Z7CDJ6_9LAMI|nr:hypothetical protein F511_20526 [Dorcoceras hygrometricum]